MLAIDQSLSRKINVLLRVSQWYLCKLEEQTSLNTTMLKVIWIQVLLFNHSKNYEISNSTDDPEHDN